MCEEPTLMKLGLSKKFPRVASHSRESTIGVGLMEPSTIVDALNLNCLLKIWEKEITQQIPCNVS